MLRLNFKNCTKYLGNGVTDIYIYTEQERIPECTLLNISNQNKSLLQEISLACSSTSGGRFRSDGETALIFPFPEEVFGS